eukprot:1160015-Pelagomonas_calceolata.AAC.3
MQEASASKLVRHSPALFPTLSSTRAPQLSKIVKPSPFKKPRAHAAFTVAGLSAGKQLQLKSVLINCCT